MLSGLLLALLFSGVFLLTTGVSAPDWLRTRIETRLNTSYSSGKIAIGDIHVALFKSSAYASVTLGDVEILDTDGQLRAAVPEVSAEFQPVDFLTGAFRPVTVTLKDARLHLRRDLEGRIDISVGAGDTASFLEQGGSVADLLAAVEQTFKKPAFSQLERVETLTSSVTLDDAFSRRTWLISDTTLVVENSDEALSAGVTFKLQNPTEEPAEASFSWKKQSGEDVSEFTARFSGFRTEDLADQSVAFDWLRILNAPISGSVSLAIDADGSFGQMKGVLDIGAGSLRQTEQIKTTRFSGAKAYLSYDQDEEKISFDQVTLDTDAAHIVAEGHAYLSDRIDRTVGAIIAQLRFTKVDIKPEGVFERPLAFNLGALDMRVHLSPLTIDIGQLVLVDDETSYVVKGSLGITEDGWSSALDLSAKSVSRNRALDLWPVIFKEKTRTWLKTNVFDGTMHNISGFLRGKPGQKPELTLGFDVSGLSLRFMKTMPPIENGLGYVVIEENRLSATLEQGILSAPDEGQINLAGTTFIIPDIRIKPAPAVVGLKTQSSVPSLLSVLDLKPFEFVSKADLKPAVAKGTIRTVGTIKLPLAAILEFDQVTFSVEGEITDAESIDLVPEKYLRARQLKAIADNSGLIITGSAKLGAVPITGLWKQKFGPEHKGKSRVEGQIEISRTFLDEFGILLPEGSLTGRGTGHMTIDLVKGKAPTFRLVSDLNRLTLEIAPLGWKKPKNVTGEFEVKGRFSSPPEISSITLKTRGMLAKGEIILKSNGRMDVARFTEVNIDDWMTAPIEIRTDRNGNAAFTITGGVVDFRKSQFGPTPESTSVAGNRISANLDKLILSSGISLTGIKGEMHSASGVTGSFSARVNGGARIVGTLAPLGQGTAVRFTSNDAGAVMRSAGVFMSASGGRMDMVLLPTGQKGQYKGTLEVRDTRVRNASALADILSAISVVGLLEQLGGEGISFSDISADFLLDPASVVLKESSAVGASLGLTMAGNYSFTSQTMNMQGVITPIYLLNGILEQTKIFGGLFGKQTGEGLFGFNYTMKGAVDDPIVGVNPLSILTPGMFREIFRQPIPEPSQ